LALVAVIAVATSSAIFFATAPSTPQVDELTTTTKLPPVAEVEVGRSRPVHLTISSLHLSVPIGQLGLERDGTVMIPKTATEVGWFNLGPTPGQRGAAVLLGHVDSNHGIGVFFWLKRLVPGSLINVRLASGDALTFTVTRVAQFLKANFPARLVYTSPNNHALNLVTCGGHFNRDFGSYESNLVVFSQLTEVLPPPTHSKAS